MSPNECFKHSLSIENEILSFTKWATNSILQDRINQEPKKYLFCVPSTAK